MAGGEIWGGAGGLKGGTFNFCWEVFLGLGEEVGSTGRGERKATKRKKKQAEDHHELWEEREMTAGAIKKPQKPRYLGA